MLLSRCSQCPLNVPSRTHAPVQGVVMNMQLSCPLHNTQSFALKLKMDIARRIVLLLFQSSPSAIGKPSLLYALIAMAARVMTIGVYSVYAVFVAVTWLWPHVCKEILETMKPVIANSYAAATPIFVTSHAGICAAASHAYPTTPFLRASHTVRDGGPMTRFVAETTATPATPAIKRISGDGAMLTALAVAQPHVFAVLVFANKTKHKEATEPLPGQILDSLIGYRHYLRNVIRGMIGAHGNSPFLCLIRGRSRGVARYFRVCYSFILPHLNEYRNEVSV